MPKQSATPELGSTPQFVPVVVAAPALPVLPAFPASAPVPSSPCLPNCRQDETSSVIRSADTARILARYSGHRGRWAKFSGQGEHVECDGNEDEHERRAS